MAYMILLIPISLDKILNFLFKNFQNHCKLNNKITNLKIIKISIRIKFRTASIILIKKSSNLMSKKAGLGKLSQNSTYKRLFILRV